MSRKQKPEANVSKNYEASRAEAAKPSPYEERRKRMAMDTLDWIDGGDYRQPPKGVFVNFADPAARQRQRELVSNSRGAGVSAMGAGANPTLVALNKQHLDDQFERDSAENYQGQVAAASDRARAELGDLTETDARRRLSIMQSDAGLFSQKMQADAQRVPWWSRLLSGGGQAMAGLGALGFAPLAGLRRGGRVDKFIGKPVEVGEEGEETFVGDDGTTQKIGTDGPEVVVPTKPGTVVPNPATVERDMGLAADASSWKGRMQGDPVGAMLDKARDPEKPVDAAPAPLAKAVTPLPSVQESMGVEYDETRSAARPRKADPLAFEQGRNADLREMEPQKTPLWKRILVGGGLGLLMGGPGGAIAGAAVGGLDKKSLGRMRQRRDVAESDDRVERMQRQEEAAWKRRLAASQVGENEAQAVSARSRAANDERRIGVMEGRLDELSRSNKERERDRDEDRGVKVSEGDKNRASREKVAFASIEQRRAASENNLKYRERKDAADRAQRREMHGDRMAQAHAALAERVNSRLSQEAARKVAQGQRATAIRISVAKAKAWAEKEGAQWDDFVDALDENGVVITDR